ncbi:MAG: extracellular solute-binding protein, partial [Candidatus Omnitrophota bacterium]
VLDADLKRCTLSSPETVATLQFYKKLSQFSLIERQAQVNELFAEGKVGMQISGSWNLRLIPQLNPQLRFGTALMPKARANGRNPDAFAGGELFVVTKRSHHPAEALKLIHFLTAQENVMEIVRYQQNVVPARRDTLQEPYYEQFPEQKVFLLQLANASPAPIHPRWNELQEHITRLVEEVIMNNADPAKAAAAATAKIDALINEDVVAGKIPGSLVNIFVCAIGALFLAILFLAGRARSRLAKDHAGTRMKNRDYSAFFYLSPWFAIFLAFGLYPLLYSFVISLAKYDILTSQFGFVGIKNYLTALGDKDFRRALWHTFVFAAGTVPFTAGLSLFCAILINRKIRFKQVFQAGLFLPVTTSVVVIATIFTYIYSPNGLANALLDRLGIMHPQSSWLNCPRSRFGISVSLISIMAMNIWSSFGYYTILFLAGLQTIPDKLYEMASLDGATEWHKFRYITYPQIKPTLLLVVVINTIYSLQVFPEIFTMTMGGPLGSTTTAVYYLYETGFHRFEMGQASAIGYLLAIIIALFSIAQMSILKTAERPEE